MGALYKNLDLNCCTAQCRCLVTIGVDVVVCQHRSSLLAVAKLFDNIKPVTHWQQSNVEATFEIQATKIIVYVERTGSVDGRETKSKLHGILVTAQIYA